MERVAFLIERSGEQISCLLNPEYLETRRTAGVRTRREGGGFLAGRVRTDHPLIATGGGVTEFDLRLLFDVGVAQSDRAQQSAAIRPTDGGLLESEDVRDLTRPFWDLAENALSEGFGSPPTVRFIWGKSWNVPGVVVNVAERLENFDAMGTPQRSWLSLRLRRVEEAEPRAAPPLPVTPQFETPNLQPSGEEHFPTVDVPVDSSGMPLDRLDQIAADTYGRPDFARALAEFNQLDDMLQLPAGLSLTLPSISHLVRATE